MCESARPGARSKATPPTKASFQHGSQWLGERIVFGEPDAGGQRPGTDAVKPRKPQTTHADAREMQRGVMGQ